MKIIGIAGNARSGKDTLADALISIFADGGLDAVKYSLAKEVKLELEELVQKNLGLSIFTEDDEEKKLLRPLFVVWGSDIRRKLNQDVWIEKLESKIDNLLIKPDVLIIPDIRFDNELSWLKKHNGYLVFVDRIGNDGFLIPPANDYELTNNKTLKEKCDNHITWMTFGEDNLNLSRELALTVVENLLSTYHE